MIIPCVFLLLRGQLFNNHRNKTCTIHYSNLSEGCTGTMSGVPQRWERLVAMMGTSAHHLSLVGRIEKPALLKRVPEQGIIQLPAGGTVKLVYSVSHNRSVGTYTGLGEP